MMFMGINSGDWNTALKSGKIGLPISRQSISPHAPPVANAPAAPPIPRQRPLRKLCVNAGSLALRHVALSRARGT
jgi:hypothetical protein